MICLKRLGLMLPMPITTKTLPPAEGKIQREKIISSERQAF
jgi:hypothetical protein